MLITSLIFIWCKVVMYGDGVNGKSIIIKNEDQVGKSFGPGFASRRRVKAGG